MSDLVDRLKAACVGHPTAEIPWPHRLLHEAADSIEALGAERDQYREWWANLSAAMREQEARISTLTAEISERGAAARERNRELAAAEARVAELSNLLAEAAAEMEENCQVEGPLSSFIFLSKRIRAALAGKEGE